MGEKRIRLKMSRSVRLGMLACLLLSLPVFAQSKAFLLHEKDIVARADQWLQPYVRASDFSGVVLIAQGDQVLLQKAYGEADFSHNIPNRVDNRFRIASLTKTFTAASIEKLVREGKLSLKDSLSRYVPGIPNGDKITVESLLLHQSGIAPLDSADIHRECLPQNEIIHRLTLTKPLFAPDTQSAYSNEGYFLLAVIIEKISQMSYPDFLDKNIFQPLGMRNSGVACQDLPAGRNAVGNVPGAGPHQLSRLPFNEAVNIGSGSVYSDVHDLYLWLRAVDTDPAFQVDQLEYPYGWGKRNYSGRDLIEQSGIAEGFDAHIARYPKEHIYAAVLSNVQTGFFNRIPKDLEAVLFGGNTTRPPEENSFHASTQTLQQYQGQYESKSIPFQQNLSVDKAGLYLQWGDYPFLRILTPIGPDEFFFRFEYAKVTFSRDTEGRVIGSIWEWPDGGPVSFKKLDKTERSGKGH